MTSSNCWQTSKFKSFKIDRILRRDSKSKRREIQLLLIGPSNSGKYTLSKQIRIHYGDGFPLKARKQLVPTILANLTEAICLVLHNLFYLRIEFADWLAKHFAGRLLDERPGEGYLCENHQSELFKNEKPTTTNFSQPTYEHTDNGSSQPYPSHDNVTRQSTSVDSPTSPDQTNETHSKGSPDLRGLFLQLLQTGQSITPSLMKRFESSCDVTVANELHKALHDPKKLRQIYLKLCSGEHEEISHEQNYTDFKPPLPTCPPPSSVEDELIDCIVALESSASFYNLPSSDSSECTEDESEESKETDLLAPENHFDSIQYGKRIKAHRLSTSSARRSEPMLNILESFSEEPDLYEKMQVNDVQDEGGPDFKFDIPRIWLKLITEQPEFQNALQNRALADPCLSHSDYYFLENTDRLIQDDYIPTLQDILVMRRPSKAIRETVFHLGADKLRIIDLADKCSTIHKRLHYFESSSAVVCMVPLSGCCPNPNLDNSIELFARIYSSPYMSRKEFVIFLNKIDLLRIDLVETSSAAVMCESVEDRTASFIESIKQRFFALELDNNSRGGRLHFYVGCALDIDEMKLAFKDCLKIIFESHRNRKTAT